MNITQELEVGNAEIVCDIGNEILSHETAGTDLTEFDEPLLFFGNFTLLQFGGTFNSHFG